MALVAITLVCAASAQAQRSPKAHGGPGVPSAAPSSQALSGTLAQITGLAPSQVATQNICPPAATGYAACAGKVLVLRSNHALVHPHVRSHSSLGRVVASPRSVPASTPPPAGTPAWLQQAYDLASLSQSGGAGDTVAIVDAFDDPNAASDLATYRSTYGLPPCTTATGCFQKVNEYGNASPLPQGNSSWEMEISLDLEAVSAVCPNCHILLVEASTAYSTDLATAMQKAAAMGANQISDSWSASVSGGVLPGTYTFPGVATVAATGDAGYVGSGSNPYPAAFAGVTAAGATTLTTAGGSASARGFSEGAWSGGGSGCDRDVTKPSYQTDTGCAKRSYADLSADGDPSTGLLVYDSGNRGWLPLGGTSLAAPLIAGYYAITGVTTTTPKWAYADSGLLNDPTGGSNGTCAPAIAYICTAGVGYDGPTGIGSISGAVVKGAPGLGGPGLGSASSPSYTQSTQSHSATLIGGVYPNGQDTTWWVEYGTSSAYGQKTAATDIGSATAPVSVTGYLSQLLPSTTYHYRLVASNSLGTTYGYDYTFTTAAASPTDPTAAFTPAPTLPVPGSSVSFDGTASTDTGASITSYSWVFGDGGTGSGANPSHTYASHGKYNVTLIVTNSSGQSDTTTQTVTVDQPTAAFTTSPAVVAPNAPATFDAGGSTDPEGSIVDYKWNFADGWSLDSKTTPTVSHAYTSRGVYTVTLTVTNGYGQTATVRHTVTVDTAPTASFGASARFTAPGSSVSFDGTALTSSGTGTTYTWNFGDGTSSAGSANTASHAYASPGVYTVGLTVTDDLGVSSTSTQVITVDQPTAAFAVPASVVAPNATATFDAGGSTDPEGSIVDYSWDFSDGWSFDGKTTPTVSHAFTRGVYTVTLTVTNSYGQTATTRQTVTVDIAPTASFTASASVTTPGSSVSFDGSASTASGTATTYTWNFGDGTTSAGTADTASHAFSSPGVYMIALIITDDLGVSSNTTHRIVVDAAPAAAFAASSNSASAGAAVGFDGGASSDAVGSITSYSWNFGDGSAAANGATPSHTYQNPGSYTVTLTVTNDAGQTSTTTRTVTVYGPPTASFQAAPNPATAGSSVRFSAGSSTGTAAVITGYTWSFGDGSTGSGAGANHTYARPGNYTVTLTVTGSNGLTASTTHTVTITPPPLTSNLSIAKRQRLGPVLKHGLRVVVTANQANKASFQITTPVRSSIRGHYTVMSAGLVNAARNLGAGTHQITLRLTRATVRKLSGHTRVTFTVRVTLLDAYGRTITRSANVSLG